jgi:hypothetical protein
MHRRAQSDCVQFQIPWVESMLCIQPVLGSDLIVHTRNSVEHLSRFYVVFQGQGQNFSVH